ncbi:VanZ family protein [Streptomyces sp. R302]|uniref:VanZ family protein n=1 Tax=unclassified Streptomyces TaxID=2593676 RepID=UPI00145FCD2F|nr:VanZ family protein [Streptomyces sp. R301]NML79595.1 VanZ family protein [Streptomyces sp. R302]
MQRQGSGGNAAVVVRVIGSVLLVAHLLLVAWVGLLPRDVAWVNAPNTVPLAGLRADLALGPAEAARLIAEGLLLLAPLGVLLPMCEGRLDVSGWGSLIRTTAAGALVSLALELLQTAVPGQVVDVDSVLLNTLGVALAHLLVVPTARSRMRRRRASREGRPQGRAVTGNERAQGRTPRIPRVPIAR